MKVYQLEVKDKDGIFPMTFKCTIPAHSEHEAVEETKEFYAEDWGAEPSCVIVKVVGVKEIE